MQKHLRLAIVDTPVLEPSPGPKGGDHSKNSAKLFKNLQALCNSTTPKKCFNSYLKRGCVFYKLVGTAQSPQPPATKRAVAAGGSRHLIISPKDSVSSTHRGRKKAKAQVNNTAVSVHKGGHHGGHWLQPRKGTHEGSDGSMWDWAGVQITIVHEGCFCTNRFQRGLVVRDFSCRRSNDVPFPQETTRKRRA